jgi:hypothetical protein
MPATRPVRLRIALLAITGTLLAACGGSGGSSALSGAPQDIVIDRGGAVEVLAQTTGASAHVVAGADLGGKETDPLALTRVRQMSRHVIAGLRNGWLTVIDPAHPAKAHRIVPGSDWFPDAAQTGAWTLTQSSDANACGDFPGTQVSMPRFRLDHHRLDNGASEGRPFYLPCGMRPAGDVDAGLLVETYRQADNPDLAGGQDVPTDVQLVDRTNFHLLRTIATKATLFDASADTAVWGPQNCTTGPCVRATALNHRKPVLGKAPDKATLVGAGSLDTTGRYLASAAQTPTGSLELVVCDLKTGTVTHLGDYASQTPGAAGLLSDDMPSVWSGSRFLAANPVTGTLIVYDTASHTHRERQGLTTGGILQVWGAAR